MLFNIFDNLSVLSNYAISRATCKSEIYFPHQAHFGRSVLLSRRLLIPNAALVRSIIDAKGIVTLIYVQPLPRMGRWIILEYGVQ